MGKPIVVIKVIKPYEISDQLKNEISDYITNKLSSDYCPIVTFDAEIEVKIYR